MSEVRIDRETFLAYLSAYIAAFDSLALKFEEIYQTDVERFYLIAIRSKGYSHCIMNDGSILRDYKTKRIFGVLLAADEDDILRNKVEKILYRFDEPFKDFVKKPTMKAMQILQSKYSSSYSDNDKTQAGVYIPVYLAINKHGTDADVGEFQSVLQWISENIKFHEKNGNDVIQQIIEEVPITYALSKVDEKAWKICKLLKDGHDLISAALPVETILTGRDNKWEGGEMFRELMKYKESGGKENVDFYRMSIMLSAFSFIAQYFGFSPTSLLKDINLNKEEQRVIAKVLFFRAYRSRYIDNLHEISWYVALNEYFTAATFYMLLKSIKQAKQYFEDNNNETIFSQIQYYREEKERQDEELERLRKELQEEREKNDLLRQQLQSQGAGATTDTKPFMEEISALNRQVKELREELETEREKTDELNRLREFVFSIQSEYVPESDETDLKDLTKGKKIVVIGGHINWRNKLKKKYPAIVTMDGHNAASDFGPLSSADLVLLNTFNMSHKVYYKVIEMLRKGTAKFDYIGRSTNQELYEKEIADIIKKYG